ncbi:MAG: hypothetical protein U0M41_02745 [Negativibacillus sp.]|nr:hypothetical protein [Negativibacillus sp.]
MSGEAAGGRQPYQAAAERAKIRYEVNLLRYFADKHSKRKIVKWKNVLGGKAKWI